MAEDSGKGRRQVKPKFVEGFVYDKESLGFLSSRANSGSTTLRHTSQESISTKVSYKESEKTFAHNPWTGIQFLSTDVHDNSQLGSESVGYCLDNRICAPVGSHSLGQQQNVWSDDSELCFGVNSNGTRNYSSTRLDYLDQYSLLSVSPTPRPDTSDMSDKGEKAECECTEGVTCSVCTEAGKENDDLVSSLNEALRKINFLTSKVTELDLEVKRLKNSSSLSSGSEGTANSKKEGKTKAKSKFSKKESRVEEEKLRQLRLIKDKLPRKESEGEGSASDEDSSDSDRKLDLKALRKKMTKKQREACDRKLSRRLKSAGAAFPEEDTTSSSGTESGTSSRRYRARSKRKVKSGSKIKKRPVVRTELWPHTIANEDDGEEVTAEDIGLAKFFACFTYIMTNCGKVEAAGRGELLHAVSSVLECTPWSEARTFHNLVMIKVEQGRLDWDSDFSLLAQQFLDKKVRLNLKSKSSATGTNISKASTSGKTFGKGFTNPRGGRAFSNSNRNKSMYAMVCRQWNYGSCSYGDNCRKWHVCWSCAEGGKPGEQHRASSHENAPSSNQRR